MGKPQSFSPRPPKDRACHSWGFTTTAFPQHLFLLVPSACCSRGFTQLASSPIPWPPGLHTSMLPSFWLQQCELRSFLECIVAMLTQGHCWSNYLGRKFCSCSLGKHCCFLYHCCICHSLCHPTDVNNHDVVWRTPLEFVYSKSAHFLILFCSILICRL
jgi:hypothetical protein